MRPVTESRATPVATTRRTVHDIPPLRNHIQQNRLSGTWPNRPRGSQPDSRLNFASADSSEAIPDADETAFAPKTATAQLIGPESLSSPGPSHPLEQHCWPSIRRPANSATRIVHHTARCEPLVGSRGRHTSGRLEPLAALPYRQYGAQNR